MIKRFLFVVLMLLAVIVPVSAQDSAPSPTPTPTPDAVEPPSFLWMVLEGEGLLEENVVISTVRAGSSPEAETARYTSLLTVLDLQFEGILANCGDVNGLSVDSVGAGPTEGGITRIGVNCWSAEFENVLPKTFFDADGETLMDVSVTTEEIIVGVPVWDFVVVFTARDPFEGMPDFSTPWTVE